MRAIPHPFYCLEAQEAGRRPSFFCPTVTKQIRLHDANVHCSVSLADRLVIYLLPQDLEKGQRGSFQGESVLVASQVEVFIVLPLAICVRFIFLQQEQRATI